MPPRDRSFISVSLAAAIDVAAPVRNCCECTLRADACDTCVRNTTVSGSSRAMLFTDYAVTDGGQHFAGMSYRQRQ